MVWGSETELVVVLLPVAHEKFDAMSYTPMISAEKHTKQLSIQLTSEYCNKLQGYRFSIICRNNNS